MAEPHDGRVSPHAIELLLAVGFAFALAILVLIIYGTVVLEMLAGAMLLAALVGVTVHGTAVREVVVADSVSLAVLVPVMAPHYTVIVVGFVVPKELHLLFSGHVLS